MAVEESRSEKLCAVDEEDTPLLASSRKLTVKPSKRYRVVLVPTIMLGFLLALPTYIAVWTMKNDESPQALLLATLVASSYVQDSHGSWQKGSFWYPVVPKDDCE